MSCHGNGFFDRHFERKLFEYLQDDYETCKCGKVLNIEKMHEHNKRFYCESCYDLEIDDEKYLAGDE